MSQPENKEHAQERKVSLNGAIVAESQARISPFDHGLTVGDGVFETLRTFGGKVFAWRRHYQRLKRSADVMGLAIESSETLRRWAEELLADHSFEESRVRVTITGGLAPPSTARGNGPTTTLVMVSDLGHVPSVSQVITVPWARNDRGALVGLKTTSYAENVRALEAAHQREASEALLTNTQGRLCEGAGTNVFLVVDRQLVTPPLSSGCLAGITRELVLELTEVVEREIEPGEFAVASEAFLTSSTREVGAISAVDDTVLPEAPGPVTAELTAAFAALVATNPDP